jgi:hypothetical protein
MRKILWFILLLLMAIPTAAQFEADAEITFTPFMYVQFDLQGLRPAEWQEQANAAGVYSRSRDGVDLTAIIIQAREGTSDGFLALIQEQFALDNRPEVIDSLDTDFFTWDLYVFERQQGIQTLIVDMAVAEYEGRTYYVLMQTAETFYDNLHEVLFLVSVESLSPIQRYQDPEQRFDVPIPTLWSLSETEDYALISNPDETVLVYVGAVAGDDPQAALQTFWEQVDPEFDSSFEEEAVRIITDPVRIGDLEAVVIITWEDGLNDEIEIKQGVARVYNGMIYMTLIDTDFIANQENDEQIAAIDNNFRVAILLDDAEATEEASND